MKRLLVVLAQRYVGTVEQIAKKRGVAVHWVNPPREADRRVASR